MAKANLKPNPFIDQVRKRLQERPATITLAEIAEKANLTLGWLETFHRGSIPDPSYSRVIAVHEYLVSINH